MKIKDRIACYDGLRGLAIISVMVWHYMFVYGLRNEVAFTLPNLINDNLNLGQFGVSLFFLLSGSLIFNSVKNSRGRKYFLLKRVSRICIPYWFALAVIVILFVSVGEKSYSTMQILANFFLVQDILRYSHIDGVFWTLVIEVKFYFIVGILGYSLVSRFSKETMLLFSLISFFVAVLSIYSIGLYHKLWSSFAILFMGLHLSSSNKVGKEVIFSLVLVGISFLLLPVNQYGNKLGYFTATLLSGLIFINRYQLSFLTNKYICKVGVVSYSLYLYHQEIGYLLMDVLLPSLGYFLSVMSMLIVIFSIAKLSYDLMENRSTSIVKQVFGLVTNK